MSAPFILVLMSACFLFFGYLGVPVPFALMGGEWAFRRSRGLA